MGLKDELIKATAPPTKEVDVNGVTIWLHGLSMGEILALDEMDGADATFWLLERMIRDADGARLFDDDDPALRDMGPDTLNGLADEARALLGIEDVAKNSDATQSLAVSQG